MLLSKVDKLRQPAVNKTRAPSGTIPATPSSIDHFKRSCQRSAKKLLRQPDFASVVTAIASIATVDAIFIPALPPIQEKNTDKGEEHGTNSLDSEVAEETNVVDKTNNVAPAEEGTELGDLVHLSPMFD